MSLGAEARLVGRRALLLATARVEAPPRVVDWFLRSNPYVTCPVQKDLQYTIPYQLPSSLILWRDLDSTADMLL